MHQHEKIDYVEFPARDISATQKFFNTVFGWDFEDYGPDYCEFSDGEFKGGFDGTGAVSPGGPLVVLYGKDLAEVQAGIEAAGGVIVKPIFEFPGGRRFHFTDPVCNELAVWAKA